MYSILFEIYYWIFFFGVIKQYSTDKRDQPTISQSSQQQTIKLNETSTKKKTQMKKESEKQFHLSISLIYLIFAC